MIQNLNLPYGLKFLKKLTNYEKIISYLRKIVFVFVSNMQVLEHSKLFSDVHTPIVLYLDLPENTNVDLPKLWLFVKKESNPGRTGIFRVY